MKNSTGDIVTTTDLQQYRRYNYVATVFALLLTLSSLCWMLFQFGGGALNSYGVAALPASFGSVIYPLVALVGAYWSFQTVYRLRKSPARLDGRAQWAWFLVGLALLASCLGGAISSDLFVSGEQAVDVVQNGSTTQEIFSFILSMTFYPCMFLGLLMMPGMTRLRVSMIFDLLITTLCLMAIGWFFVALPGNIVTSSLGLIPHPLSMRQIFVALAYPCGDIFLLLVLALLLQQGIEPIMRFPVLLLMVSFLSIMWADSANAFISIFKFPGVIRSEPGLVLIEPFLLVSFLLIGLAALYQHFALLQRLYNERLQVYSVLPTIGESVRSERASGQGWRRIQNIYVPLALLLSLIVLIETLNKDIFKQVLYGNGVEALIALSALAGGLIAVRHFFAARENDVLLLERDQRYKESEHVRRLVGQLTDIRDLELLRERIVSVVLSEFGFTSAMLLLIEEYSYPLTSQSHLLVSTASLSTHSTTHSTRWRLRGDTILFKTVFLGENTEIQWDYYIPDTPAEVRIWLEKQRITSMVFFPIIYQGKIMGSLGVARHALSHYHPSEGATIRVYTEQIAAIIEHAYLYQETREREAFARALANISTRLNAAVVEPAEISQLMCEEGANALRADYAIFYLKQNDGQLEPIAATLNASENPVILQEWPSFHISDYETEARQSLHPILLHITQRRKSQVLAPGFIDTSASLVAVNREPQSNYATLRAKLSRHYIQTAIFAPLVAGGHVTGLLVFARAVPPGESNDLSFDATDLPHAQDFVEQAGVTFANAQLYQRLRDTHERLKELDQLKDQFMITASHELRTPLTAVQGYIELIAEYDDILPPEQRREFLQKAQLGCDELAILLRNVMDASRLEAEAGIKPALISRVSVKEMIEKVQIMIEPQITHERRAVIVNVPAHLVVFADPLRLHQVLMNVSTNAIKYSPAGSPITFTGRISTGQGRSIVISISDRGKGIAPEDQPHLFQRFFRLEADMNSPVRGSGLGLYISRRLIGAMGGKIWIESTGIEGEGSTFHVQLPMA